MPWLSPRLKSWLRAVLAVMLLAIAGAAYHFTRPATLAQLILPRASDAIGGEVLASRIAFGGLNTIVLSDLKVRVPGWDGVAGELPSNKKVNGVAVK